MKNVGTRATVLAAVFAIGTSAWAAPFVRPVEGARAGAKWESRARGNAPDLVERLERLGNFSILLTALRTANLEDTLATGGPFTVFAPTDDAFADLLAQLDITAPELLADPRLPDILLYHVAPDRLRAFDLLKSSTQPTLSSGRSVLVLLEGRSVLVNRAEVLRANVPAENGIIHVIDRVLLPPDEPVTIDDALDVLQLDGRFTVLLAALSRTGLDDAVAGAGPFTIFAPTDEAFGRLLAELGVTADELLDDPNLADILLYHVLGRRAGALQLLVGRTAETLQGGDVTFRLQRDGLYVNDARVVNPEVNAPNAVLHTIDKVLLP